MSKIILEFEQDGDLINTTLEAQDVTMLHLELSIINLAKTAAGELELHSPEQYLMGLISKMLDSKEAGDDDGQD